MSRLRRLIVQTSGLACEQMIVFLDFVTPGSRFRWAHVKRGEAGARAIFF